MALTEIDKNLLKRCLACQSGAWKDLVNRFIGLFIHVINHSAHARGIRLKPDDVDDLCAEVFLGLLENDFAVLRRFEGKCSLATYLTVVARRIVVRSIARRRIAEALGHVPAHGTAITQAEAGKPVEPQRLEDREEIQQMLEILSDTDAEIVRQFHLEGRS